MTDWAEKIADEFCFWENDSSAKVVSRSDFIEQLRKAKADGLKEADKICERQIEYYETRKAAATLGSEQFERFYNYKDCTEFIRSGIIAKLESPTD